MMPAPPMPEERVEYRTIQMGTGVVVVRVPPRPDGMIDMPDAP